MAYDVCVIGGGIIGLATALEISKRRPGATIVVLEKEDAVARHQTGRNSGVIHAGIYYTPGSLKARLCREGAAATKAFCRTHGIPFDECGKLVVATSPLEMERLSAIRERARVNEIEVTEMSEADLRVAEPAIAGLGALKVHATGIVSYSAICRKMADLIRQAGGEIRFGTRVDGISESADAVRVETNQGTVHAGKLVVCAGLQSDRLARMAGLDVNFRIVPFRGEYYVLPEAKSQIVRHLIYPVPDPSLPFLGIHLTRMIDGRVTLGPNAVLGLAREGYKPFSTNLRDMWEIASFPGAWKMARKHLRSAAQEFRNSQWKRGYLEECRKYCPSLELSDLLPYPTGIRAQVVLDTGELHHDFLMLQTDNTVHVCNAASPAATSAIPIAAMIADQLEAARPVPAAEPRSPELRHQLA